MTSELAIEGTPAPHPDRCAGLIEIMGQQERLCSLLVELSRRERAAMLEGHVELVESVAGDKGRVLEDLDRLEQLRRRRASDLAREMGLTEDATLLSLAARLGGEEAAELLEIRHRVAQAVSRLRETNDGNIRLIRGALEAVRDSIRQMRQAVGTGNSYTRRGEPRLGAGGALAIDCHA